MIGWIEEAKLKAFDANEGDDFGWSVSLSGNAAVIGAQGDDDNELNSGSAHVYRHDGTVWIEEAKLTASNAGSAAVFGFSVAINGNIAMIGATGHDSVYFFGTNIVPSRSPFLFFM